MIPGQELECSATALLGSNAYALPQLTPVTCGELMAVQDVAEITDGIPLVLETSEQPNIDKQMR